LSTIAGHKLHRFYSEQAKDFRDYLASAQKELLEVLDFVNFFKIPDEMQNGHKEGENGHKFELKSDADFFSRPARPIFYAQMGRLSALGVDLRDLTAWRRNGQSPVPQAPTGQNGELVMAPPEQQKQGILNRIAAGPKALVSVLSPAPLEEPLKIQVEEPFETVLDIYDEGRVMVENFGEGMAEMYLNRIRIAVDKNVTRLLRKLRAYTNERQLESGDQLASIAR